MSRWEMAEAIAVHCGLRMDSAQKGSCEVAQSPVRRPPNLTMDISKLQALLPFKVRSFAEGLSDVFP